MKRFVIFCVLCMLFVVSAVAAQGVPADTFEEVVVEFWPDFDRPDVLVLMTATLPPDATLPAQLTLSLPEEAVINAVARADESGELFVLAHETSADGVTFTTPDRQVRLEYYVPYLLEDGNHVYTFEWLSPDIAVDNLQMIVQRPAAVDSIFVEPTEEKIESGFQGLATYWLAPQTVPAGDAATVRFSYAMPETILSVDALAQSGADENTAVAPPASSTTPDNDFNWAIILGALGLVIVTGSATWFLATRQKQSNRPAKPRPVRQKTNSSKSAGKQVNFCHNCGQPVTGDDQFCRSCGVQLKN